VGTENIGLKTIVARGVDPALWRSFRAITVSKGSLVGNCLSWALREWTQKQLSAMGTIGAR